MLLGRVYLTKKLLVHVSTKLGCLVTRKWYLFVLATHGLKKEQSSRKKSILVRGGFKRIQLLMAFYPMSNAWPTGGPEEPPFFNLIKEATW